MISVRLDFDAVSEIAKLLPMSVCPFQFFSNCPVEAIFTRRWPGLALTGLPFCCGAAPVAPRCRPIELDAARARFGNPEIPTNAIMLDAGHYAIKKKDNVDKGQRELCGCKISKDIGQYDTCPHLCEYCYANTSKETACRNYRTSKESGLTSETITGK